MFNSAPGRESVPCGNSPAWSHAPHCPVRMQTRHHRNCQAPDRVKAAQQEHPPSDQEESPSRETMMADGRERPPGGCLRPALATPLGESLLSRGPRLDWDRRVEVVRWSSVAAPLRPGSGGRAAAFKHANLAFSGTGRPARRGLLAVGIQEAPRPCTRLVEEEGAGWPTSLKTGSPLGQEHLRIIETGLDEERCLASACSHPL